MILYHEVFINNETSEVESSVVISAGKSDLVAGIFKTCQFP